MPDLKREGLIQALQDFGVDMSWEGLDVGLTAVPVVHLQDLALNYQPALRAKMTTRILLGAGGAGNFCAFSVPADANGFWVVGALNASGTGCIISVTTNPVVTAGGVIGWNVTGDDGGQVRNGDQALDFFSPTPFTSSTIVAGLTAGFQVINVHTPTGFLPLWVPPRACLNVQVIVANVGMDFSVGLVMPANNPGRLP